MVGRKGRRGAPCGLICCWPGISGPLLAVFLLKGKARWLLAAIFGGMLAAFFAGSISGFLAGLVSYDAMAAVLYISPAVEEGLKLILFLLFSSFVSWKTQRCPTSRLASAWALP